MDKIIVLGVIVIILFTMIGLFLGLLAQASCENAGGIYNFSFYGKDYCEMPNG